GSIRDTQRSARLSLCIERDEDVLLLMSIGPDVHAVRILPTRSDPACQRRHVCVEIVPRFRTVCQPAAMVRKGVTAQDKASCAAKFRVYSLRTHPNTQA